MGRPLIMDVDTGVDDAIALALASCLETHDLVAVTTVAGNVPIDLATMNTLRVLSWIGADVPVYRGMSRPLVRPLHTATSVHGHDGLGGWDAPPADRDTERETAPEAILRHACNSQGEIDGVFVGPLTNLAVALALEPELASWFRNVTIMGGSFTQPGNVTPAAEFNVFADPEAAAIVARSDLRTTWVGLDVTHQTALTRDTWARLVDASDPMSVLLREVSRQTFEARGKEGIYLHDPLAVAVASDPDLIDGPEGQVLVDVGPSARGETRVAAAMGTARAASTVDFARFMTMFHSAFGM